MTDMPLKMDRFERPDPILTRKIVTQLKSQGIFDEFRRECMADVDTKPAYLNLRQRVEGSVAAFLRLNPWRPEMNKNQLRDNLRRHIQSGGFLDIGVDRIVDQVVNPKIYTLFLPKVEELIQNCLGMDKGKPVFEPPPQVPPKPEPSKFQNKHNLAPRAVLTATQLPSVSQPPEPAETEEKQFTTSEDSPSAEKPAYQSFLMEEEEEEAEEADDDEESPPFEPHAKSERLILGVRTDSSDSNSNDNQVVTTIVDDNLEEIIDKNEDKTENNVDETTVKEEDEKDGFVSDDSVPKTPTINMEGSDGNLIEFNSISEYKRYRNKFDDESLDNEEYVTSSHWTHESDFVKGECGSNEEDSGRITQQIKTDYQHFDEKSSSSFDKSSSCDEIKSNSFTSSTPKKIILGDDNETLNEIMINDDSNTDMSLDTIDIKQKHSISEHRDKSRSSSSSKEGKSHHHHHSHDDRHNKSSSHHRNSSKSKHTQKEHKENLVSSGHSSREWSHGREDKHNSKDRSKDKSKSESSSSKHHSRDSKSKHRDRDRDNGTDKKHNLDDKIESDKDWKESRHEHRDRSRDYHSKENKSQDRHDKHSDIRKDHDSTHKHSSDKRHSSKSSKHSHSSSKHGHKSSSEKHRSDRDEKHTDSSDKHRSYENEYEKDSKHESKKKRKEYCKSSEKDFEGRRSSDRDSNGPSGSSHFSNHNISKSTTSRNSAQRSIYSSDKTTSNSDNTVSDNVESLHVETSKFDALSEQGIASPDPEIAEEQFDESKSVSFESKNSSYEGIIESEEHFPSVNHENDASDLIEKHVSNNMNYDINHEFILLNDTKRFESTKDENVIENDGNTIKKYDTLQSIKESVCDDYSIDEQEIRTSVSVHDTSSEKENIDFAVNYTKSENISPDVNTDDKIVKFKKPKIAANIFEVRKIMQERRHLKRMEKKRLKLLMKTNNQDCPVESSPEVKSENQDVFLGFDDSPTNKIEVYDCLISGLNNEISLMNDFEVNPNLVTSLIEVNPELDEYIETVLNGKVHRNYRVRVPPICDDFYKYDVEQKAYILIKNPGQLVDNNLNNLSSLLTDKDVCSNNPSNDGFSLNHSKSRLDISEESASAKSDSEYQSCILQQNPEIFDQSSSKSRLDISEESASPKSNSGNQNFILQANPESDSKSSTHGDNIVSNNSKEDVCNITNSEKSPLITADELATLGIETSNEKDINAPKKLAFSLTFNQTYDDILKDREQNTESLSRTQNQLDDRISSKKRGSTVVKITNNKATEQVIMKRVEFNFLNKSLVPKITRTESLTNGKMTQPISPGLKQMPLISRINKSNSVVLAPSSSVKPQRVNGIASLESSSFEAQVAVPDNISPKTINDVIGIVDSAVGQRSSAVVTCLRQRNTKSSKHEELRQHQRYDNSDLYKPRPQLGSRRNRGQPPPEIVTPAPAVGTRKRAAATPQVSVITPKRRR